MGQQKVVCRYNIIQNFNTEKGERKRKKSGFFKISYLITGTVAFLLVLRIRNSASLIFVNVFLRASFVLN